MRLPIKQPFSFPLFSVCTKVSTLKHFLFFPLITNFASVTKQVMGLCTASLYNTQKRLKMSETEIKEQLNRIERNTLLSAKNVFCLDEASVYINRSKSNIYKMCCSQTIPHYKQGGSLYFSKDELDKWMLQNRVATTDEIEQQAVTYVATHQRKEAKNDNHRLL
jgi:excisionase family DNA binding protein